MIAEAGYVCVGISHSGSFSARSHVLRTSCGAWLAANNSLGRVASFAGSKNPDANLGGLVPASNAIGVNVYVDHASQLVPPLIMPQIPTWKPSRHQSEKNFRQNQAHVWWCATKHISPAHTQTSPQ
ncbi:hypothetical protein O181_128444 [Austropuccinia psidii MF-1]|uniref:Uncharacterized protein n=1 Tax=Austropuccinia psidii MF-1 TaxID=1389203 RepID=A0A9Q3L006_9BASI|nr:hypothetical protein [Austropuccinia psidii MF-1]